MLRPLYNFIGFVTNLNRYIAYNRYGSDASQAIKGGNNLRAAAIGMGVCSSHGVERAHLDGIENTTRLMLSYVLEG